VSRPRPDWLAAEVDALGRRGLSRAEYYDELTPRVRRAIGADAVCWHTLDPSTLLLTSDAPVDLIEAGVFTPETVWAAGEGIIASEYMRDDFNRFAALARRRTPVAILGAATRGSPERSARYREVLEPAGIPYELRAAFVTRGRAWGAVHVARRAGKDDFDAADAAALARVAGAIAEGIRGSLRIDAARRAAAAGAPGLVLLGRSDAVELITPPARELLGALHDRGMPPSDETPPSSLRGLAAHARDAARAGHPMPAPVAVPSALGWITLNASVPEGASGTVAIVLERSATEPATALALETQGVTEREREVAMLLARGLTNPEIAAALVLSPYTVQDHIKSLFEKTGVGSRQELVARVFIDDYMPRIMRGTALAADGTFVTTA
jgi:DNA-binding CsgD family transcriptional regulator